MDDEEKQALLNRILNDEPPESELEAAARAYGEYFHIWYEEYIKPIDDLFRSFIQERLKNANQNRSKLE